MLFQNYIAEIKRYHNGEFEHNVFWAWDEDEDKARLKAESKYHEILAVADENGGKLKNRCVFYCDEFGTLPKIESAEMMFSASRSRKLQIVLSSLSLSWRKTTAKRVRTLS